MHRRTMTRIAAAAAGVLVFAVAGASSCDDGAKHCQIGADAYAADTGATVTDVVFVDRTSLGDQCDLTVNGAEVEILVDLETHQYRVI